MEGTRDLASNLGFTLRLHASEGLGRVGREGTYSLWVAPDDRVRPMAGNHRRQKQAQYGKELLSNSVFWVTSLGSELPITGHIQVKATGVVMRGGTDGILQPPKFLFSLAFGGSG